MLAALVRDGGAVVGTLAKRNTAKKDRSAMRKWRALCRLLNTCEVRDCLDAHSAWAWYAACKNGQSRARRPDADTPTRGSLTIRRGPLTEKKRGCGFVSFLTSAGAIK